MNKQEIFTRVVQHLRKQRRRAAENGACMYKTADGLKCAVGCLIADEHYHLVIERSSVNLQREALKASIGRVSEPAMAMLRNLQGVHDHAPVDAWESQFTRLASDYGVKVPA